MAWYYHLNGENQGPVETSELQNLKARDVITLDTPVWTEGMANWAAYQTTSAYVPASSALTPLAARHTCVQCFQSFPETEMLKYEQSWVCPTCKPLFFQRLKEGVHPAGHLDYASVGTRFLAILIDGLIFGAVFMVLFVPFFMIIGATSGGKADDASPVAGVGLVLIMIFIYIVPILYEIFFIGKFGATLGKMAMKIKVVRPDGTPVSYGQATGRYFAKILSGMILYIGYLMAFWDPERKALHDQICNTRVTVK